MKKNLYFLISLLLKTGSQRLYVAENDQDGLIILLHLSPLPLPGLGLQSRTATPGLFRAQPRTQDFMHAKQTLYQVAYLHPQLPFFCVFLIRNLYVSALDFFSCKFQ